MATLLSYGSLILSRRKSVTTFTTAAVAGHPLAWATDDVLGTISKLDGVTGGWDIDLGAVVALHYIAIGSHSFSPTASQTQVWAANTSDFASPLLLQALTVAQPTFWLDLRPFAVSARYVRVFVADNSTNLYAGEIVVGQLVSVPSFQWDYTAPIAYLEQLRGQTPYGGYFRRKHNVAVRGLTVRFAGGDATMRTLWNVGRQAQTSGGLVVMMPDDSVNDAWFIDWPDPHLAKQITDNRSEFGSLTLQEQSPGLP